MRSEPRTRCPLCKGGGDVLYGQMDDRLFGVPGRWDIRACSADDCGILWLDPVPVLEDLHLAYRVYSTHAASPFRSSGSASWLRTLYARAERAHLDDRLGYRAGPKGIAGRMLRLGVRMWPGRAACAEAEAVHLPAHPGGKVLDVGCGNGRTVSWLRSLGWDAEGIDVDAAALAVARSHGLPVRRGDLASLEMPPESYDAVTLIHVIEHVHDPVSLLADCRRVIRRGGRLVVVTPNAKSFLARRYGRDWLGLDPPRHLTVLNRHVLRRLLSEAGFEEERCFTSVHMANSAAVSARAFRRRGRHDLRVAPRVADRVRAELVQQALALWIRLDSEAGEEIVAVVRRP